tara:strand:+ start:25992 stop:26726 length:735 start_codon:yes stop_codon:yes gene_type:complete
MFQHRYDSRHEPDIANTNAAIIQYLENLTSESAMAAYLRERDQQLKLELESTHSLVYVAQNLVELFPAARYIVTIREPMEWLRSRMNFHFKKHPPVWEQYRQYFWMDRVTDYAPEEALLREHELASLDVYLAQYNDHYERIESALPKDKTLILRTNEISNACDRIADFLNIKAATIFSEHANTQPEKALFVDQLDTEFVVQKVWQHCSELIRNYFPERLGFYTEKLSSLRPPEMPPTPPRSNQR